MSWHVVHCLLTSSSDIGVSVRFFLLSSFFFLLSSFFFLLSSFFFFFLLSSSSSSFFFFFFSFFFLFSFFFFTLFLFFFYFSFFSFSLGSGLTDVSRAPTEPSAETSWGGTKSVVSWDDAQESDEEMEGTEETSKRQKVQMIEAALQVVNEECTEFTGGGEEIQ